MKNLIGKPALERIISAINQQTAFKVEELKVGNKNFVILPHFSKEQLVVDFEIPGENWGAMFFRSN